MSNLFRFRLAAMLVVADVCLLSAAEVTGKQLAQHSEVAAALKVLDAWIAATAATREQPGLSVGIVHDQDLIWAKGYGFADLQKKIPATPATLYRIASISKLFTSTAIMQLRDSDKLQLDDRVSKHLSWFKLRHTHPGPEITIRHLITHTSGLPREAGGTNWSDLDLSHARRDDPPAGRAGNGLSRRDGMEVLEPGACTRRRGGRRCLR